MVRRQGDTRRFAGGRAAERLKMFELQRGLGPLPADPDPPRPADKPGGDCDET